MKKIIFFFLAGLILFACNSGSEKMKTIESRSHEQHDTSALTLNIGAKWQADSITNHNVVNLKTIANYFKIKPFPSLNDYQILGTDMNNGLNQLVQQCRMTGPDHEALHHWLEPLLQENKELKNASDTATARRIFKSMDEQIDNYHNYFDTK